MVLNNYYSKCCVTGLNFPELLVASHIIPWSKNEKERLNPRNGLCLNSLHDRAYDKGFMTVTADFEIKVSNLIHKHAKEESVQQYFTQYHNKKISVPVKFVPSQEFLDYHHQEIFIG
jgi:putative restriction endonuclease